MSLSESRLGCVDSEPIADLEHRYHTLWRIISSSSQGMWWMPWFELRTTSLCISMTFGAGSWRRSFRRQKNLQSDSEGLLGRFMRYSGWVKPLSKKLFSDWHLKAFSLEERPAKMIPLLMWCLHLHSILGCKSLSLDCCTGHHATSHWGHALFAPKKDNTQGPELCKYSN